MLKLDKQVYRTFKVVNNNIVIVKDSNGREMIAIGKGLGFKKSKNDIVYPEEIMKTYIYLDRQKNIDQTDHCGSYHHYCSGCYHQPARQWHFSRN